MGYFFTFLAAISTFMHCNKPYTTKANIAASCVYARRCGRTVPFSCQLSYPPLCLYATVCRYIFVRTPNQLICTYYRIPCIVCTYLLSANLFLIYF